MNKKIITCFLLLIMLLNVFNIETYATETKPIEISDNNLIEVENLIGHYQFNIAAGSNINAKGDRGYSHISNMAQYEINHNEKLLGNSSGGYLDNTNNKNGTISKAYLVIETSTVDYSLPNYPITFISGTTNNKIESKVEYYCFKNDYNSGNKRRSGYIDVTDFVKENGYGWYYCCNIPYNIDGAELGDDQFAGWKLIVIEENYDIPVRLLKLDIGSQNISGKGQYSNISISGEGIKTSKKDNVTGQFLFGMAGADPSNIQNNKIEYATGTSASDISKLSYKTIFTKSNIRTEKNPLTNMSSRNGIPLQSECNFENPIFFNGTDYSETNTNGSYLSGSGDLELLDINSSSEYYHNVKIENDKELITFKFQTVSNYSLMTSVLGIAMDIDVPSFDNKYDFKYDKESNLITVEGTFENITESNNTGLINPLFYFEHDKNLTMINCEAKISESTEDGTFIYEKKLSETDIIYNKENNLISFNICGNNDDGTISNVNKKNNKLSYIITFSPNSIEEYYSNTTHTSGNLSSNGINTNLFLEKIAIKEVKNTLDGIAVRKNLSGKIIWNDMSDKNSLRPEKIDVSLCMDSVAIDKTTVTGRNDVWYYSFDNLDAYKTFGYEYMYDSLIQDEYENYDIKYDEKTNDIIFSLKKKELPLNTVPEDTINFAENCISDITILNMDMSAIFEKYGIKEEINKQYNIMSE